VQSLDEMKLTLIQVESCAGDTADEIPGRFQVDELWLGVEEILDRWYQVESLPEWPRAIYFKVRASDERQYLLKHDQDVNEWFLGQVW
jgi:hypothetical protein